MEERVTQSATEKNGCFTVAFCTLLTLIGLGGIGVGVFELGFNLDGWSAHAPRAVPILASALLDLFAAVALGLGYHRNAIRLFLLALACHVLWSVLTRWGWLETGGSVLEIVGLLLATWLKRGTRQDGTGLDSPSKPTPLRGEA